MNHVFNRSGYPLGTAGRVLLLGWSLFLSAGFAVAARLEPDPRGYGTHQSLGFRPCTIRSNFGIPCPSCGMTTSFAHFTRGQFLQAARSNSAGLLLAVFCAVQIPWCWFSVFQSRLWKVSRPEISLLWTVIVLSVVTLAQWISRLLLI